MLLKRRLITTQSCRVLLARLDFTWTNTIVLCAFDHDFDQYKATTEITITTTVNHCIHNIAAIFITTRLIFSARYNRTAHTLLHLCSSSFCRSFYIRQAYLVLVSTILWRLCDHPQWGCGRVSITNQRTSVGGLVVSRFTPNGVGGGFDSYTS